MFGSRSLLTATTRLRVRFSVDHRASVLNPSIHSHSVDSQANVYYCQDPFILYTDGTPNLWRQSCIRVGLNKLTEPMPGHTTSITSVEHIPIRTNKQKESCMAYQRCIGLWILHPHSAPGVAMPWTFRSMPANLPNYPTYEKKVKILPRKNPYEEAGYRSNEA